MLYDDFVAGAIALTKQYVLGNPADQATTLGPRANGGGGSGSQADRGECRGGRAARHRRAGFSIERAGTPYLAPQLLLNADQRTSVMREEIFGPVAGVLKVRGDDEAVKLMNDSRFGLTAAIWTEDADVAAALGDRVDTGTWFMNRCDYLDPALAWVGVKDSGRGCTLSRVGYEHLTRPKSFHLRTRTWP
jgi:acyl-CoA reductase-like NAD-dependent aldehyde dehydrogenase